MTPTLEKAKNRVRHTIVPRAHTEQLAKKLLEQKENALVCWEHSRIVDILNNMGMGVGTRFEL